MTRVAVTLALASIAFTIGCVHLGYDAHPLYEGEARPSQEVAKLSGPIARVDGVDVSRMGAMYALLPGCHIVELKSKIGEGSVNGAWSEDIGHVVYALEMKAGHLYVIDAELRGGGSASVGNATVGSVKLRAIERDANGKAITKLSRVKGNADIERCRAADATLQPKPEDPRSPVPSTTAKAPTPVPEPASLVDAGIDAGVEVGK